MAPGAAVVKQVNADVGQRVRQGDVLIFQSEITIESFRSGSNPIR